MRIVFCYWRFALSLLVIIVALTPIIALGQFAQPYRYELEQKNSDDYFHIISLKEKGLALFRERDKFKQNNKIWQLVFLDSTLKETRNIELEIKERNRMIGYEMSEDHIYFLFRTGESNRNDLYLIEVSLKGEALVTYDIKPDLDFKVTHFIKAGKNFVFGGYVNNEAVIVLFDPSNSSLKVVPGFFQKDTELVDIRTNANQTFNTVLFDRSKGIERKLIFKTFDQTGLELLSDIVAVDNSINLQSGLSSSLEREELLVVGTWGDKSSKQSHGFFTLPVNPFGEQKIQYYSFGELNHSLDYLSEKRAERIKESTRDMVKEGKRPSFVCYVTPFRMAEDQHGFYLLAEVYNPSAPSQSATPFYNSPYYGPYGYMPYSSGYYYPGMSRMYRPYMYSPNQRTNEEVKTLSTIVLGIDENGKVKWDQSLNLDEVRLPALAQVGDFIKIGQEIILAYKKESDIIMKRSYLGDGVPSESTQKISTQDEGDLIKSEKETEGGVRHWFGNSFYVWGYQTIKNNTKEDRVRDVFYINRIDP